MSGEILAVVHHEQTLPAILNAAAQAAALMRIPRIQVLAIKMPALAMVPVSEGMLSFDADQEPGLAAEAARLARLQRGFSAWSASAPRLGLAVEWIEADGWAEQLVDEYGEHADLIVLGRPGTTPSEPERRAIHAALFDASRPVLVVPPDFAGNFGRNVAIAWRGDARTEAAVRAALRWLKGADLHVLAGSSAWSAPPSLPALFAEAGTPARLDVLPISSGRVFGAALLARAHALGADMLVLGAFAHPMLRGLTLGGVTRHMLAHADLPVLLRA